MRGISLNNDDKKSLAISAGILLILLILFSIFGHRYKLPIPGDSMMVVSFGNHDSGSGDIQPHELTSESVSENTQEDIQSNPASSSSNNEITANDNIVEAPDKTEPSESNSESNNNNSETDSKETEDLDYINQAYQQAQSNDTEGDSNSPHDQGSENGTDNTNHNQGGQNGNSFFEIGPVRGTTYIPKERDYQCNEKGKVAVILFINKNGEVVGEPKMTSAGTTNTASCLVERAIQFAKGIKYESNPKAPNLQKVIYLCDFELN